MSTYQKIAFIILFILSGTAYCFELESDQVVSTVLSKGNWDFYEINPYEGIDTVEVFVSPLDNSYYAYNLGVYIKKGSKVTPVNYDCKSIHQTGRVRRQGCIISIDNPSSKVTVLVTAYKSSKYKIKARLYKKNSAMILKKVTVNTKNVFKRSNGLTFRTFFSRMGASSFSVKLSGTKSDAEMYVSKTKEANRSGPLTNYLCKAITTPNQTKTCIISLNPNAEEYINIVIKTPSNSEFTIDSKFHNGRNSNVKLIEPTVYVRNSAPSRPDFIKKGEWKYFRIIGRASHPKIQVLLSNNNTGQYGDVDVYINKKNEPTLNNYECKSTKINSGLCEFILNSNEVAYIGFYGATTTRYSWQVFSRR